MKIIVAGLNHKSAPIDVREKLAFSADKSLEALTQLKNRFEGSEFVLLSTCNRVEMYCACSRTSGIDSSVLIRFLSEFHNIPPEEFQDFLYVYNDADAVRHLLTVASSLDSMVIGETQIISQIKEGYKLACEAKSTERILNRLFHCAFATSKKILANTSISNGRVSVAGVAVELATQLFSDVRSAKVAVIGAGETGELLVQHFLHTGCRNITVINRSFERGLGLAGKYGVYARGWEELAKVITDVDIIVASASSQGYLFEEKTLRNMIRHRRKNPLLIIDVAVPRNFSPDVNKIEDIYLYSIDELSEIAEQNRKAREEDIAKGLQIIEENVSSFMNWFRGKDIGPVIGEMKNHFAKIGQKEIENFFVGARQDASCREAMEAMTHRVVNRLLHCVIKNIDLIAQKYGPAEAAKLADDIVEHAKEILRAPESSEQSIINIKHSPQPNQILRLLFWESTIKCNLACAHCRRLESNEAAEKDLSTEMAKGLIEQTARLGKAQAMMPLLVFSGGEPLCRNDLFELIAYARSLGLSCALATNGTLVDSKIAEQIKEGSISRVSISLDGATADVHNKLRKQEGSFEKALEGARQLHRKGVPFQINLTLTRQNAHQLEDVYRLAMSLGAVAMHIFMLVPVGCGQTLAGEDILAPEQYEEKLLEICRLDALGQLQVKVTCGPHYARIVRQQGLHKTHIQTRHFDSSRGCLAGTGILFVSHQGDVFPCGYLPVNCGNVLKEELRDIWRESEELARIRDRTALEGKCGICDYRKICGGCRARAYAATGNYMAEEPFCVYVPTPPVLRRSEGFFNLKE
jgi:glutamyl-tRNA reductase